MKRLTGCRNVGNCNGCMGWTRYVQEPHGFVAKTPERTAKDDDALPVYIVAPSDAVAEAQ